MKNSHPLLLFVVISALCSFSNASEPDFGIRHETQANTFTFSSQSAAAITDTRDGGFVVAWHSRRQQEGTYGVYLQRFARDGHAIGKEQQVNIFTRSMQMNPALATDSEGGVWVAWESYGQDGSFNSIVTRRFSGKEFIGGDEILVNQFTKGNQSQVVIAAEEKTVAFYWVTQNKAGNKKLIASRTFGLDGKPSADESPVASSDLHQTLPTVATSNGRHVLAWAELDEYGRPAGIRGHVFDSSSGIRKPFKIKGTGQNQPIEPSVSISAEGVFAVSWLRPNGNEHELWLRTFDVNAKPMGAELRASGQRAVRVSGAAVEALDSARFVVTWNQQTDQFGKEQNVLGHIVSHDCKPIGKEFSINKRDSGKHELTVASGKRRVLWDPVAKQLQVAWSGQNANDKSAVNVTAFVPEGSNFAFSAPREPTTKPSTTSEARPHEPPTYDPKLIAKEPFGGFKAKARDGNDFGFVAINSTGWVPPDPVIAAGPNHLAAMTNGAIAFFEKDGNLTFSDQIEGAAGFWGAEGATGFVFDPEIIYDEQSQRFFAMANERGSDGRAYFLLAASDDDDPNGDWFRYRLDVTDVINDDDIDSPNFSVDDETVYLTADFFGPDKFLVYMLDKSDVLQGNPPAATNLVINGSQSYGVPQIYDVDAPAAYMIQAFEFGTFSTLRLHAITDSLTDPQRVQVDLSVPTYGHPVDPVQQGTTVRPELFEARFWSCVYRNGSLWAVHHHSPNSTGLVRVRWYQIAMNDWPVSGQQPSLVQSGELTPTNDDGQQSATFFPSIWVDDNGNAAITTARSSSSEFISMSRAVRAASDPFGEFQEMQVVQPSTTAFSSVNRWGDYSGTSSDPIESGVFWGIHEFTQSPSIWQTYIAQYVVEPAGPAIEAIEVASGEAQRSILTDINVLFSTRVDIGTNAFALEKLGADGGSVDLTITENDSASKTGATLTFSGTFTEPSGSLIDGNYRLTVNGANVLIESGGPLDIDADGSPGGVFVFGDTESDAFYRLFGDSDQNRVVNLLDLLGLRQTYLMVTGDASFDETFDSNLDGLINVFDLLRFRQNWLKELPFNGSNLRSGKKTTKSSTAPLEGNSKENPLKK